MNEVKLARNAREPHIGDVLRWDGQGWVPDVVQSRWSVIQAVHSPMMASVREGPGIDVLRRAGGLQVGMGGDTVLLYDAGGSPVAEYAATGAGLVDAVAAAGSGDTILLPSRSISITSALTTAAGVTLAGIGLSRSVLAFSGFSGTALTMGENCVCQMFTLTMVATGTTGIGIDATAGGVFVDTVRATASGGTVENTGILTGGGKTMNIAQYSIVNEKHGADSWAVGTWSAAPQCFGLTAHVHVYGDWARSNFIWSADVDGPTLNDPGTVVVRLLCENSGGDEINAKVMNPITQDPSATPTLTGDSSGTGYTTGDIITIGGATSPYPGDGTAYFCITLSLPNEPGTDYAASFCILDVWYEQGDGVWLLYDDNEPILLNCIVDAYGVDAVGVQVVGDARARLYHCQLSGKTYDIQALSGGVALVCGCQYSHDNVDGDIVQEPGDRATFEVGTQHADDIEAGTMTRHLPAPSTAGKLAIDQGTVWESKAISGGITLAATGVATLAIVASDIQTISGISWTQAHTFNAAPTFAAGAIVPDTKFIGVGAALERIEFYTAGYVAVMGANFGVGIAVPAALVHAYHAITNRLILIQSGDAQAWLAFQDDTTASNASAGIGVEGDAIFIRTNSEHRFNVLATGQTTIQADGVTDIVVVKNMANQAADLGSGVRFVHNRNTAAAPSENDAGFIYVRKVNATAWNTSSYMQFGTRLNGGVVTEQVRIDANGNVVVNATVALGKFHVDNVGTIAQPVAYFDQGDVSEEFFQLETTIGVGNAMEAVGTKTLTPTHFVKVTIPGGLTRYFQVGTIA